tara:strand:+ start:1180 stop:1626 length:447 start_codon:yes stop_codon:yes gene_type:complete
MAHNNYELSLGKKIQEFKNRIQDLERINRMHEALNGQLRQEISRSDDATTFNGACMQEAVDIANLVCQKQTDYGTTNITMFGLEGIMIRLSDKINRLTNLIKNDKHPENESLQDTLTDIAGYAIIGLMLSHKTFELPLRKMDAEEDTS